MSWPPSSGDDAWPPPRRRCSTAFTAKREGNRRAALLVPRRLVDPRGLQICDGWVRRGPVNFAIVM